MTCDRADDKLVYYIPGNRLFAKEGAKAWVYDFNPRFGTVVGTKLRIVIETLWDGQGAVL